MLKCDKSFYILTHIIMNKSYKHFSKTERYELFILKKKGYCQKDIAKVLNKSPSSISRELKRNQVNWEYIPDKANHKAYVRRKYSKTYSLKIISNPKLREYIHYKTSKAYWTPKMIAGRINKGLENHLTWIHISFKTIYNYINNTIYWQELQQFLFSKMAKWSRKAKRKWKHIIHNMTHISKRPSEANLRKEIWHLEFDTMWAIRLDKARIAWWIDRFSRKVFLHKVSRLSKSMRYWFKFIVNSNKSIIKTWTFDRWVENVNHQSLAIDTFFCDPYSGWQKWSMEQAFLRLRRFINKKSSIESLSNYKLHKYQEILNNMPMECLNWKTPNEIFKEHL